MTLRHLIFPGILAISAASAASTACSAPDPGLVIFSTNPDKLKADSGVFSIADGGAGGEGGRAPPASVFDGEGPYISTSGSSTEQTDHMKLFGTTNPAGMDCLSCHEQDATTPFTYGGTVMGPADAGLGNVQVLMKNTDDTILSTFTDSDGNFFFLSSVTGKLEANAKVGVRNATSVEDMPDPLTGPTQGGCNQKGTCHGGTQGAIHLP